MVSTDANADDIIIIMNGNEIHTLKTHTTIFASVGSARNNTFPKPRCANRIGNGDCGVATNQFHDVADTTTGTIHGNNNNTLNKPFAGICVRNNNDNARPTIHDPNTPTIVKTNVNNAAFQNDA
ncbi:hypothetical protein GCM10025867_39430 [Frondihabitans sucicola]|uniref:Uncharacterized protein n=1 Tax=Frondihabitans sucicola TaxID=1268041 RepID=A0ABN6XT50_9MICO|nr:hypothetical protein GCM10025867_04010 [Frondihabitans sucicola]BDZ51702.1 hypothetical protein GCM10025867_39430 [Frondihabitans sucicola]